MLFCCIALLGRKRGETKNTHREHQTIYRQVCSSEIHQTRVCGQCREAAAKYNEEAGEVRHGQCHAQYYLQRKEKINCRWCGQ